MEATNNDRELSVEVIRAEQTYARMWSERTHHPDDHAKIWTLLRELEKLQGVIKVIRTAVRLTEER